MLRGSTLAGMTAFASAPVILSRQTSKTINRKFKFIVISINSERAAHEHLQFVIAAGFVASQMPVQGFSLILQGSPPSWPREEPDFDPLASRYKDAAFKKKNNGVSFRIV